MAMAIRVTTSVGSSFHFNLHRAGTPKRALCHEPEQKEINIRLVPALLENTVRQHVGVERLLGEGREIHLVENSVKHGACDHLHVQVLTDDALFLGVFDERRKTSRTSVSSGAQPVLARRRRSVDHITRER